ncbi:phosphotransferase [Clostridium sp. C2-6-12]|uniref:phosphotransferase n=1 Tax=Clostridium sp. C2-6-12 TaxID=2698832 RepID=UPI001371EC92|nr:phosphotransferase [Clostridium sp. C2-6-12]
MSFGKLIGIGNTANVYEWDKDKVVKLFHSNYPKQAIETEFHNAMAIRNMPFQKPKAYEMISHEGKFGIVYDMIKGESLLDFGMKTGNVERCSEYMAKLHKEILTNKVSGLPNYKEFLKSHIPNILSADANRKEELSKTIDELPDGDILCHGDFHPGNILICEDNSTIIDFMNICQGTFLYDIARTVFLVEYTPVPMDMENREQVLQLKKKLADLYLLEMKVTREMIQDYLEVIIATREGECPNEKSSVI